MELIKSADLIETVTDGNIYIHTSDRNKKRRCLLKWHLSSPLRMNLDPIGMNKSLPLWIGSALHFVWEDYFGYNRFGDPKLALCAYYDAFNGNPTLDDLDFCMPSDAKDFFEKAMEVIDNTVEWYNLKNEHLGYHTAWFTGSVETDDLLLVPFGVDPDTVEGAYPGVEIPFRLRLPKASEQSGKEVYYAGTVDRVLWDRFGKLYLQDYKHVKAMNTDNLDINVQANTYLWGFEQVIQHPLEGMIWWQIKKSLPKVPKRGKTLVPGTNRGALSTDKSQKILARHFKIELIDDYGSLKAAPDKYITYYNSLLEKETLEGDYYIRWDVIRRGPGAKRQTFKCINAESAEMLNEDLAIYPNPTRDCSWDCPFETLCSRYCAGEEIEDMMPTINALFTDRDSHSFGSEPSWRGRIRWEVEGQPV